MVGELLNRKIGSLITTKSIQKSITGNGVDVKLNGTSCELWDKLLDVKLQRIGELTNAYRHSRHIR
jgi:hypothetical protein